MPEQSQRADGWNHHSGHRLDGQHKGDSCTVYGQNLWFLMVRRFCCGQEFSFSKATQEYIYAPDADEVLDDTNRRRFMMLKAALLPEVRLSDEIHYSSKFNTVQNSSSEYRPKLFKRLRTFTWINPVHETVRLEPVVYDSDICIQHLPQGTHGKRDFTIFKRSFERNGTLPKV